MCPNLAISPQPARLLELRMGLGLSQSRSGRRYLRLVPPMPPLLWTTLAHCLAARSIAQICIKCAYVRAPWWLATLSYCLHGWSGWSIHWRAVAASSLVHALYSDAVISWEEGCDVRRR